MGFLDINGLSRFLKNLKKTFFSKDEKESFKEEIISDIKKELSLDDLVKTVKKLEAHSIQDSNKD